MTDPSNSEPFEIKCISCGGHKGYLRSPAWRVSEGGLAVVEEWVDCELCHGTGKMKVVEVADG